MAGSSGAVKVVDVLESASEPPDWALSWATALAKEGLRAAIRVPSNEVNQVFWLESDSASFFLKIGPNLEREYRRLECLQGRLPTPCAVGFTAVAGIDALLQTAVEGDTLSRLSASLPARKIVTRLAAAIRCVHATGTADWPFGGTGSVLVHGDACLPNFLFDGPALSGYIDVGDMTLAEPEGDLAAAVWSLQYNLGAGHRLAFLREVRIVEADEAEVQPLRLVYHEAE